MKKRTKRFIKDLTKKQRKKLKKVKLNFSDHHECPLGVLYGTAYSFNAIQHIIPYSNNESLDMEWANKPKKAKKYFKKWL